MEDGLILVVTKAEVISWVLVEVFLKHRDIVPLECVEEWKVTIVVHSIRPWLDFINDWKLFVDADDMLDGLSLVVLSASCHEKFIVTAEPVEDVLVSVSGTLKEWVLTKSISHLQTLELEILKDFEHLQVLVACGKENWRLTLKVLVEARLWLDLVELSDKFIIFQINGNMHWSVTMQGILGKEIETLKVVQHVLVDLTMVVLNSQEERCLSLMVSLFNQKHHLFGNFISHLVDLDDL